MANLKLSKHTLCVLEVVSPQRSNFVLATDIPYCETDVLVLYCLYIKTWRKENNSYKGKWTLDTDAVLELYCFLSLNYVKAKHYFQTMFDSPIVGIVVTISPSLSLYKIVVFPAASRPTIRILISFFPNILKSPANIFPMVAGNGNLAW